MSDSFFITASVGAVVATLFLVLELFLLPLFDLVREKLSIACIRWLLTNDRPVSLHNERFVSSWFGLSDGVYSRSKSLTLTRLLKTLLKICLVVTPFVFEFQIDSETQSTTVNLKFPSRLQPLSTRSRESWIVSPLPFQGLGEQNLRGLVPFGQTGANVTSKKYESVPLPGFDLEYIGHCTGLVDSRREVYAGVLTTTPNSSSPYESLVCLNGTEGRPKAVLMSYDPDSTKATIVNFTSVTLNRFVADDGTSRMYAASVNTTEGSVLRGYTVITFASYTIKDVGYSMYGFFMEPSTRMIKRLNIPLAGSYEPAPLCNETLLGVWQRDGLRTKCPNGMHAGQLPTIIPILKGEDENTLHPAMEDIGLEVGNVTELVSIGDPLTFVFALLAETKYYEYQAPIRFTQDVRDRISSDLFYYSPARKDPGPLQVGVPREYTTLQKSSTITLFTIITILLLYSVLSFMVERRSRSISQVKSECYTRDALLSMLRGEPPEKSVQIGLTFAEDKAAPVLGVISTETDI